MEKGKGIDAIDGKLHLPKEIIHHIQGFLNVKQAASTSVLSKSWCDSWLTHPCLDFDERYFQKQDSDPQKFFNFVKRTMERYHELNLNIDSFKLWMNVGDTDSYSLATESIMKAVKMGAKYFNLAFLPPISDCLLPKELLEAKFLVRLFVAGCRIFGGQIMCSRLKSLQLCQVGIGDDMIRDIMLNCPLIEDLFFSDCVGMTKVNLSKMVKLKRFGFTRHMSILEKLPLIEFEDRSVGSVTDDRIVMSEFRNLSYLLLENVKINRMLFSDFSKNFPCIEGLTISHCSGCRRFNILSNSLKYITLAHMSKLELQLYVPNICRFEYLGPDIPKLSLVTSSSQWESHITFVCREYLEATWFLQLRNFLLGLQPSKITLSVGLFMLRRIEILSYMQYLARPEVEHLIVTVLPFTSVCLALLDVISWGFQTKFVSQHFFSISDNKRGKASNETLHLLCKKLMDQKMFRLHELKEAEAEFFEDTLMEWRPLPWKALYLLDALGNLEKELEIRFRLEWETTGSSWTFFQG